MRGCRCTRSVRSNAGSVSGRSRTQVRALSAALDLAPSVRDAFVASARGFTGDATSHAPGRQALPLPPTPLIGREGDLQRLQRWVADPAARLVTLIGPGGVGKTRLAVALGHALASDAALRVLFVPLSAVQDAGLVASAVAEAFGLDDATARDLPARVRAACHDAPTWLVLDNFEQVATAAPLVADLLTHVASLRILVTSRAPLHVRGEREYAVEPLGLDDLPTFKTPADLAGVSAVQLFVSRVQDVRSDFRLTPTNSPIVAAICRRLDGLPLALELAAPWVKALAPEGLLSRLQGPGLLATEGPSDLPERQRTMNATVAWSVRLLEPLEQRAFRRLGAIPGRFSIAAAAAVFAGAATPCDGEDAALPLVLTLLDKSLLLRTKTPDAADPSYVLLETVRAYAARELMASGEHADAMEGLVHYCLAEGVLAAPGVQGPRQIAWLDRVRDDLESHRAVLTWLLAQGRAEDASGLAWSLVLFWIMRGHSAEGLRWFDLVQQRAPPASVAEARSQVGAALMRFTQGTWRALARRARRSYATRTPIVNCSRMPCCVSGTSTTPLATWRPRGMTFVAGETPSRNWGSHGARAIALPGWPGSRWGPVTRRARRASWTRPKRSGLLAAPGFVRSACSSVGCLPFKRGMRTRRSASRERI